MLLKKAGMVVLGAAAGVAALSGTAFAGDLPSSSSAGHEHSWDGGDRGHHGHHHGGNRVDHNVAISDDDFSPSASNEQGFFGDQTGLVNLGNTNVQAPISAVVGLLSSVNG